MLDDGFDKCETLKVKMEVDSEKILNNEKRGRVLRKRKKQTSYADRVVKRRTNSVRRRRTQRHRSLDPPKKDKIFKDSFGLRPSTSSSSLKSVIYLGYYRKIPQLITLDDNSDSIQNQGNHQKRNQFTECQNATTSSSLKDKDEEQTLDQVPNNPWNLTQDTNLLHLLSQMCVDSTHKGILTRARTREFKN